MIGDFDDELFAGPKEIRPADNSEYVAKCCTKDWYTSDNDDAREEAMQIMKYRADRAYSTSNYSEALGHYQALRDSYGTLSLQLKRETQESIGRCHLHLGELQPALEVALAMCQQARNKDHRTCSWMLLAKVYHQLKNHDSEVQSYVKLLELHPMNAFFWASFAEAFASHWGMTSPEPVAFSSVLETYKAEPSLLSGLNESTARCIVGSCFIRVRLIQQSTDKKFQIGGLSKHSRLLEKAEEWINRLNLSENFKRKAGEVFSRDVFGEKDERSQFRDLGKTSAEQTDTDDDGCTEISTLELTQFYKKWFSWINTCSD